jgi:hypothetical protein
MVLRLLIAFLATAASISAEDLKARMPEADSTGDIHRFCSRFREFGEQHEASYTAGKTKLFVAWVQPKEHSTPAFLFAYAFRANKWHLVLDYPPTAEFANDFVVISIADRTIKLIDPSGHVAKTYEIEP